MVARNPDEASSLPFLVKLPLVSGDVVLKVRDIWPRTAKVYCHRAEAWPGDSALEIVERVPVKSCVRRGVAIDLVLDRARENRSQFVFTKARGRDVVFWQSARTRRQARPNVSVPTARATGSAMEIVVDTRERYGWKFSDQQASVTKRKVAVGDYAVERDGAVVAVVERKSIEDLVSTVVGGKLWTLLAALAGERHGAVVVEGRYSELFRLSHVRPVVVTTQLAEATVRYPMVSIVFAETRKLAQEWTYRFFGAALEHVGNETAGAARLLAVQLDSAPGDGVRPAVVRAWARHAGYDVADRGRIRPEIYDAYHRAHQT
ncbi:MAG: histone-like nucleoid-structuring protein Lsr2 [Acidimicrobiales bacterium]